MVADKQGVTTWRYYERNPSSRQSSSLRSHVSAPHWNRHGVSCCYTSQHLLGVPHFLASPDRLGQYFLERSDAQDQCNNKSLYVRRYGLKSAGTEGEFSHHPASEARPGFLTRLLGNTREWLSIQIEGKRGVYQSGGKAFTLSIKNWHSGGWVSEHNGFYTLRDARSALENCLRELRASYYRLRLQVATELFLNPQIPEGFKLSEYALHVPDFMNITLLEDAPSGAVAPSEEERVSVRDSLMGPTQEG